MDSLYIIPLLLILLVLPGVFWAVKSISKNLVKTLISVAVVGVIGVLVWLLDPWFGFWVSLALAGWSLVPALPSPSTKVADWLLLLQLPLIAVAAFTMPGITGTFSFLVLGIVVIIDGILTLLVRSAISKG